jgi:SpoVK/Ycf46/Vps4 family AAA+-type ATPase
MGINSGKKSRRNSPEQVFIEFKEVKPLNYIQGEYLESIRRNEIVFGIGSAGTGKTFVAAAFAASARELLNQCGERLVEMGGSADKLASQVLGLQAYVKVARKSCGGTQ